MPNGKKLRYWCQKVLPQVYDDSLSYYELLNKVVDYLNHTIEDVQDVSTDYQEFADTVNAQMAVLTQDMTTLGNTVGQFDDRITLNTNEIHILDNEMGDTLQYEGVVTTFPNPTRYCFYKVPEGHDTTFPEEHVGGSLIVIGDSQGETFTATYLTNSGRVYNKMKNALGWSEWASDDIANENRINQTNEDVSELQEEDIKTLKYRGFTIRQEDLGELPTADPPQCYRSGYYTPQVGQGDMPTGETITAQNQYRYLIAVINNFLRDPASIVDTSERTWLLYGPNAKMWWAHGSRPRANTWSVFDPSAIDVSNLEQMVQALSAQYEAVDDRMDDIEGAVTTNTSNISSLNTRVNTNTSDIQSLSATSAIHTTDIANLKTRTNANEANISSVNSDVTTLRNDMTTTFASQQTQIQNLTSGLQDTDNGIFYKAGDVYWEANYAVFIGMAVTAQEMLIMVPVQKSLKNVTNFTITEAKGRIANPVLGFVDGSSSYTYDWTPSPYTTSIRKVNDFLLCLRITKSSDMTNLTGGAVVGMMTNSLRISFS